jgi:hypothetical protein
MALTGKIRVKQEIATRFSRYSEESGMHLTTKVNELLDDFLKQKGF